MTKRASAKKARSKKPQPEKPMIVLGPGQRMQLVGPIVLRGGTQEAPMNRTLYWRPCPYFCPDSPDHFRSWAALMAARAGVDGPVTLDVPEAVPFPRGTHDLSGVSITVTECAATVRGVPGTRCVT